MSMPHLLFVIKVTEISSKISPISLYPHLVCHVVSEQRLILMDLDTLYLTAIEMD